MAGRPPLTQSSFGLSMVPNARLRELEATAAMADELAQVVELQHENIRLMEVQLEHIARLVRLVNTVVRIPGAVRTQYRDSIVKMLTTIPGVGDP